jgi:hypothetical protein
MISMLLMYDRKYEEDREDRILLLSSPLNICNRNEVTKYPPLYPLNRAHRGCKG